MPHLYCVEGYGTFIKQRCYFNGNRHRRRPFVKGRSEANAAIRKGCDQKGDQARGGCDYDR